MKTIKSKIFSGVLFLFLIIIILSVIAVVFINQLAQNSRGTIIDNYRTIDYSTGMFTSLDEMYKNLLEFKIPSNHNRESLVISEFKKAKEIFESNLNKEISNITEPGEKELVNRLRLEYTRFTDDLEIDNTLNIQGNINNSYAQLKNTIKEIYSLNMSAIKRKNAIAEDKAGDVIIYTILAGAISIVITLFFVFTFPSRIVRPLKNLTEKIKAISRKEYDQEIIINSGDEIGQLADAFNLMSKRLKEYETRQIGELLTANKRLEALVHNMQDGILVLDNNGKVILVNNVMAELSGISPVELNNKPIAELAERNDFIKEIITSSSGNKNDNNNEVKSVRIIKNNKELYYDKEVIPIVTESENHVIPNMGNMIILKNITRYEERDVAKTKLISTVSHEMKTPVSSINLTIKLLEDSRIGELNTEQRELVQSIKDQSNRLSRVINEILNYSQIEAGNIRLNFIPALPEDIVDYATTALMMLLSEKNIQLDTIIEDNLPSINIDVEKTVWVLVNLLNNAIRYSKDAGKIILSAGKKGETIFFSVKDFGPGISAEDQKKLFGRFSQVGQRSERGWGLGLAISKEFVQAQGGLISVESKPGEGSTFRFTIPVTNF